MSPEQAAGKTDVTVAADVYAMGAILYWMVAGRAPITGESAFEIVRKTIDQEPESMRDVRPDADRDLNLICLKALRKDPSERYASAIDFAADLRAWLAGEPLSVKPPTLLTSARRWLQKNFRGVAAGIGTGTFCGLWMGLTLLLQIADTQLETANSLYGQLQAADPPMIAKAFSWVELIPKAFRNALMSWTTLATAICGLATIGLSKPNRGDSGVTAAFTATLLSGILAFVISWAWAPIANNAHSAVSTDLELMTDYLFIHPDDRHIADQVLLERYPGIPGIDTWQRGELLRSKVSVDQSNSVPEGLLTGFVVTLFVASLPLFVASVLASFIWHRGHRGWGFFWRSLEVGFYATTFMFLFCRSLSSFAGAPPLIEIQVISAVVMMAAIFLALKRMPFWIRIPLFIVVLFTFGANMNDSNNVQNARWIAQEAKNDEALDLAATLMERNVEFTENREQLFRLATLYAYLDRDDDYLRTCTMLLKHDNFYHRRVAEQASKVLLLKPELHDNTPLAHRLARWASEQRAHQGWDYVVRSFSEYRQGNSLEAIQWADKAADTAIKQDAWKKEMIIATAKLLKALAYQKLGNTTESKKSLLEAESLYDPNSDVSFEAKLTYKMLRDELNSALGQP